jgi:hypothetical protein
MTMGTVPPSNFAHLFEYDEELLRLGVLAEKYFVDDPSSCLIKLREFAELLAQLLAARVGLLVSPEKGHHDLQWRLEDLGYLPREIAQLFGDISSSVNGSSFGPGDVHRTALSVLKISWQLGLWFHRTFGNPAFKSGPFIPPAAPEGASEELSSELNRLSKELKEYRTAHRDAAADSGEAKDEQSSRDKLAAETEQAKLKLKNRLAMHQAAAATQPPGAFNKYVAAGNAAVAALRLDEAETRQIIDQQLRHVGWQVDSAVLRYAKGTRPEKGKNLAIAEWPTESGPADYVLFAGLTPVAVVEAKRKNIDFLNLLQHNISADKGQLLIATHNPLMIGTLHSNQVRVITQEEERTSAPPPEYDPIGIGVEGLLKSELYGLRATLAPEILGLLDRHYELLGKKNKSNAEQLELMALARELNELPVARTHPNPYFEQFAVALAKQAPEPTESLSKKDIERQAELAEEILAEVLAEEGGQTGGGQK